MRASTHTYMTCLSLPGTGTPQSKVVREMDRSLRSALDEGDQFVTARFGVDVAFVGVEFEELVAVLGEAEEVGFFFGPFDFGAGGDGVALAVADFGFVFCVVGFVRVRSNQPAYFVEVDVAVFFHALPRWPGMRRSGRGRWCG